MPPGFHCYAGYCQDEEGPLIRVDKGDTVEIETELERRRRGLRDKLSLNSVREKEKPKSHEHKPSRLQDHLPPNKGWGGTLLKAPERCPYEALERGILQAISGGRAPPRAKK